MTISPSTVVVAASNHVACELGDEVAILNLTTGAYHGLDAASASVWKMLDRPITVADIRDGLLRAYDVGAERCEQDLIALLERLHAEGLVEIPAEGDS
jgi:hypothetical protein